MRVTDFDFDLPSSLIAQEPASPRDSARLLYVPETGSVQDVGIRDLARLLHPGDRLIVNDTRVIPARLTGTRIRPSVTTGGTGAKMEITLHKAEGPDTWRAFAKPAKKLSPGDVIDFGSGLSADFLDKNDAGEVTLRFSQSGADLMASIQRIGIMPLPPYIKRDRNGLESDMDDYQTLFAANDGAVAAPTASLHFTPAVLSALEERGVQISRLTLHVGAGTFLPVKVEDTDDHEMHSEWGELCEDAADEINQTLREGGRVVAAGTTALRLVESAADENGVVHPFMGETDIFITPGYTFRAVDVLLSNFHLPKSTLFMLVSALVGTDHMKDAYAHAMKEGYRFYSYGDATLLERRTEGSKQTP